jgi:hypothetical protein
MPSPFPGVDPFIEDQEWEDFHSTFNTVLRESLAPGVEPRHRERHNHCQPQHVADGEAEQGSLRPN